LPRPTAAAAAVARPRRHHHVPPPNEATGEARHLLFEGGSDGLQVLVAHRRPRFCVDAKAAELRAQMTACRCR
jgi:hypothetical protein